MTRESWSSLLPTIETIAPISSELQMETESRFHHLFLMHVAQFHFSDGVWRQPH